MQPPLPPYDPKRQADSVVRAYRFQFLETAIAWLELGPSSTLLVEVAEDFDVQSDGGDTTLTQVAYTSTDRRLTLASKKSREALNNFWSACREGADPSISLNFHTNMTVGKEANCVFPDGQSGIDYWRAVQSGADPLPLCESLKTVLNDGPLLDWLNTGPSREETTTKLFGRISWKMAQEAGPERSALLTALIVSRLNALGIPIGFASNASKLVMQRISEVASCDEVALRRLTAIDLNRYLHEVARPGQPGLEGQWDLASWTARLDALPLPRICAARAPLVGSLASKITSTGVVWLCGASGAGKSTLAQQTAYQVGGDWLLVDFRDQTEVAEYALRLERIYTDITLTENASGVVLDDLNPDLVSPNGRRFAMLMNWLRKKNVRVAVTSAQAPSPALAQRLSIEQEAIVDAPYLEMADIEEMVRNAGAPQDMLEAWAFFIHVATAQGHPQLCAAKIVSLAFRSWPKAALTEDLVGEASEAIELTRAEARRRLLHEAQEHGRALLKRLSCIFLRFDRSMAIAAAAVDPAIQDPSASIDLLTGPWIERAPGAQRFFRLSPLLSGLSEDLSVDERRAVQASIVVDVVKRGAVPSEAIDIVFWNALFSEQGWFFVKSYSSILMFSDEQSRAFASKLSAIVYLSLDRLPIPSSDAASFFVRMIQLDVAAINGNEDLFQPIAEAALREAEALDGKISQLSTRTVVLTKILFSQGGRLEWSTRLAWLSEYDQLCQSDPLLEEKARGEASQEMIATFGDRADVPGFLLMIGLQSIQTPKDLVDFFNALDGLNEETRRSWLDRFSVFSDDYSLHVQSAWSNAWLSDCLNAEEAISDYSAMEAQARAWSDLALAHQCVIAQSVLWDEAQDDQSRALDVVDAALAPNPEARALLRQKARVLGHIGDYEGARSILERLRSELAEHSPVDQLFLLREEAVAAAKLGDFGHAEALFRRAAGAGNEASEELSDVRLRVVALRAEAALCAWWNGERSRAITELASVLKDTAAVAPDASDSARNLHLNMRWLVGWVEHSTRTPRGGSPPQLVPGAMSALDRKISEENLADRGSFDSVKVLLLLAAYRCGVTDLSLEVDWSAAAPVSQMMLAGEVFDLTVESRRPDMIATAILNVVAGLLVIANDATDVVTDRTRLPIKDGGSVKLADCSSELVRATLCGLVAVSAFRLHRIGVSIRGPVREIIQAIEMSLGGGEAIFADLRIALENNENLISEASRLVSDIVDKERGPLPPGILLQCHLRLVACVQVSGAGARTAGEVLAAIADDWAYVIDRQRFLLPRPMLSTPQLEDGIERVRGREPGALHGLLDIAARGLNTSLPEEWIKFCEHLGGVSPEQ